MDLQALYLRSDGRISRKTWWIGTIVLILASILLTFILSLVGLPIGSPWSSLINLALVVFPAINLGLKRRHDRDNNGTDYLILTGVSALMTLMQAFGIGFTRVDIGNGMVGAVPDTWMGIVQILFGIYAIYMLVQLGFLKGTPGANTYGADPQGYAVAA